MNFIRKSGLAAAALCLTVAAGAANAVVMVSIEETGADVVATFEGTIDLTGLSFFGSSTAVRDQVRPNIPIFFSIFNGWDAYTIDGVAPVFGSGGATVSTSHTGQSFGWDNNYLYVPSGHTSRGDIMGSMTFASADFTSLGMTEGTYTTVFSNGEEIILTVGTTVVPLPASLPLLVAGLGGLGLAARRKTLQHA